MGVVKVMAYWPHNKQAMSYFEGWSMREENKNKNKN